MLEPGDIVDGRFEVEGLLGEGGLAQVFRVRHTGLGSLHALKLLTWRKKSLAERLIVEGRIQAQLVHPNIVAVTDIVKHDGQLGLLMEYVDSQSLEEHLDGSGAMGVEAALAMFAPILAAVTTAHDAGVTHRDLKPANVLLSRSGGTLQPKVTDFGIAKVVQEVAGSTTAIGATMGTPGYLAPEQVQDSSAIDARADVFALGAIAYEMITGWRAFGNELGELTLTSTLDIEPPMASERVPGVPEHVDAALTKAMSKKPADRYADCREFARSLLCEHPALLALVEGQVPTGVVSLENVRETLNRSLAEEAPARSAMPRPTLVAPVDPEPEQEEEQEAAGGGWGWKIAVLLLLIPLVGGLIGVTGMAGGVAAFFAKLVTDPTEGPVPEPVADPVPVVAPVVPGGDEPVVPAALDVPDPAPVVTPEPAPGVTPEPGGVEPVAAAPEPAAPEPVVADVPEPVVPDPVEPAAVVPEPIEVADPVVPEPEPVVEPAQVPEPAEPVPEPQPAVSLPAVAGSWTGRANNQPLRLSITTAGSAISGTVTFLGFSTREEVLRGSIGEDGSIRFEAAELSFVGTVDSAGMRGTYQRAGGKALGWSVQSK